MFEQFLQDVANMPVDNTPPVSVNIANNPTINAELLKQYILTDIPIPDDEMYRVVKDCYKDVLRCIVDLNLHEYLEYVTSPKFLVVLRNILSVKNSKGNIDDDTRRYCNKIAYDYITMFSNNADSTFENISNMMMDLSRTVNRHIIHRLTNVGLNEEIAGYIALARYSSNIESTNIMRVNFILCKNVQQFYNMRSDLDRLKAEQMIVDIFQCLYDHLSILFETIMFDVYDIDAEWMNDDISEMYSIISLAVLDILEYMPSNMIIMILTNYAQDYVKIASKKGPGCKRFSLKSLSADYYRINLAVEQLTTSGVFIP